MDTYISLLDFITHDTSKNFISKEFWQPVASLDIATKNILVEVH
jgi:hypothetical protein